MSEIGQDGWYAPGVVAGLLESRPGICVVAEAGGVNIYQPINC